MYIVYVLGAVVGVGYGVAHVLPWVMLPDVVDYDELKLGEKTRGHICGHYDLLYEISEFHCYLLDWNYS